MLYKEYIAIQDATLHKVGNKLNEGGVVFSKSNLHLDSSLKAILSQYFLTSFKFEELYSLYHQTDIALNEVYSYVSKIFENHEQFHQQSMNLAAHLYEKSVYPKIKTGEFYVIYFKDCILDEHTADAIGLFKSENKETFLKIFQNTENFNIESEEGININKLDKGCLIFNIDKENGYVVAVVDNTNKGEDAKYWIDDFLHVRPRKDEYYNTHNVLSLCKNFVTKELPQQFDVQKADQADLLNRSVQFFKEKDSFDMEEFTNDVFAQREVIDSFNKYKENYEQDRDLEIADSFTISESAVKKQARAFKSVIKLDKNFHIYVHGNRNLIEQGEDEKGKFYKVYYQEES